MLLIIRENDSSYLSNIQNFPQYIFEIIKNRIDNFDWLNRITYYLTREAWIKKIKFDSLEYLIKRYLNCKFYNILNLIKDEFATFWEEYLEKRRES